MQIYYVISISYFLILRHTHITHTHTHSHASEESALLTHSCYGPAVTFHTGNYWTSMCHISDLLRAFKSVGLIKNIEYKIKF